MRCPRCHGDLVDRTIGPATVSVCGTCTGALVQQRDLVPVLETLAELTLQVVDPSDPIAPMPDPGVALNCPLCDRAMEPFGYQGSTQVIVDRCGHDAVIWADAHELGAMSILYARATPRLLTSARTSRKQAGRSVVPGRADTVAAAMLTGPSYTAAYGNLWQYLDLLFGRNKG